MKYLLVDIEQWVFVHLVIKPIGVARLHEVGKKGEEYDSTLH